MVSVLLPALLLTNDALTLTPLIIVGVVTSYVVSARLTPAPAGARPNRSRRPGSRTEDAYRRARQVIRDGRRNGPRGMAQVSSR